jgi:hypothetical protein
MLLEQNRENQAVENDVVLADEMNQFRFIRLPPILPPRALGCGPLHGRRDVPDGRVKPNVKDFSIRPFHRHRHSPIEVPRHRTALQSAVNPAAALTGYVGFPGVRVVVRLAIEFTVFDVRLQPTFVPAHGQVPQCRVL